MHPQYPSALSSPSAMPVDSPAHIPSASSSQSDSDLSDFQAELEKDLSSAMPGSSVHANGEDAESEDAMDVETDEDNKPVQPNKSTSRRMSTKEYFDPELYGLRRSVDIPCCRFVIGRTNKQGSDTD